MSYNLLRTNEIGIPGKRNEVRDFLSKFDVPMVWTEMTWYKGSVVVASDVPMPVTLKNDEEEYIFQKWMGDPGKSGVVARYVRKGAVQPFTYKDHVCVKVMLRDAQTEMQAIRAIEAVNTATPPQNLRPCDIINARTLPVHKGRITKSVAGLAILEAAAGTVSELDGNMSCMEAVEVANAMATELISIKDNYKLVSSDVNSTNFVYCAEIKSGRVVNLRAADLGSYAASARYGVASTYNIPSQYPTQRGAEGLMVFQLSCTLINLTKEFGSPKFAPESIFDVLAMASRIAAIPITNRKVQHFKNAVLYGLGVDKSLTQNVSLMGRNLAGFKDELNGKVVVADEDDDDDFMNVPGKGRKPLLADNYRFPN